MRVVNYESLPGSDSYNYAMPPMNTKVSGCSNEGNGTVDCSTLGGNSITVDGTKLRSTAGVHVGSSTYSVISVSGTRILCTCCRLDPASCRL